LLAAFVLYCYACLLLLLLLLRTSVMQGLSKVSKVLGSAEHGVEVPEVLQQQI
jgi:hypothetical protein